MSDTTFSTKDGVSVPNGSYFLGISVRGWLALMLTGTVCLIVAGNTLLVSYGITSANVSVPEPLYSGFMTALGFYLGQQKVSK